MEITKQDLKQRVYISKERGYSASGTYAFDLEKFFFVWALIKTKKPHAAYPHDSFASIGGATYDIYVKKNPNIVLTSGAWIIHKPKLSPEQHFKAISVYEAFKEIICLSCNLISLENGTLAPELSLANYDVDGKL